MTHIGLGVGCNGSLIEIFVNNGDVMRIPSVHTGRNISRPIERLISQPYQLGLPFHLERLQQELHGHEQTMDLASRNVSVAKTQCYFSQTRTKLLESCMETTRAAEQAQV